MINHLRLILAAAFFLTANLTVHGAEKVVPVKIDLGLDRLRSEFLDPPKEYTQIPFWFWNDELTEEGIKTQIAMMEEKGVHGFVPHGRIGLSKKIGYMTDEWLRLLRVAVDEAARRGMTVYLYDEGMYPSGSAHGEVVKGRPDLASQGLRVIRKEARGPDKQFSYDIKLEKTEKLVAAVLMKKGDKENTHQIDSAKIIPPSASGTLDIPDGDWTLFVFAQTPSGGVIRGVHWDEESNKPNAPPASDLLNPETTERFIQFAYDKQYQALKPHFGKTVRAMFTDEPSFFAKGGRRGLKPWTAGFLTDVSDFLGYDFTTYLPLLWVNADNGIENAIRHDFQCATTHALNERYYKPLSDWCRKHQIELTGHPAGSGDMDPIRYFQQPGQDVVWRWVLPGKTSLEGKDSTLGKSATSVAYQMKRPLILNECYGAYGWRLTMGEMKWLADWLFVRGTNRLSPHAFYYSVEGDRIYERPPCVAWNNLWWDDYALFSAYTNRMSWLLSDIKPVTHVAILTRPGHTPWQAAKILFENQVDFHYLDVSFLDDVSIANGKIAIGHGEYRALILDDIGFLHSDTVEKLSDMVSKGVTVISAGKSAVLHPLRGKQNPEILQRLTTNKNYRAITDRSALAQVVKTCIPFDFRCMIKGSADLRYLHFLKKGVDFYLFTNEGEKLLQVFASPNQNTIPEIWNAETGEMALSKETALNQGTLIIPISLYPRQSTILAFSHDVPATPANIRMGDPFRYAYKSDFPKDGWILDINNKIASEKKLGSWTDYPHSKTFSGTGWYNIRLDLSPELIEKYNKVTLDLGTVHESAKLLVNGTFCGTRLWRPFHFDVSDLIQAATNEINIGVTNTRANELTDTQYPSGLFGPVKLYFEKK